MNCRCIYCCSLSLNLQFWMWRKNNLDIVRYHCRPKTVLHCNVKNSHTGRTARMVAPFINTCWWRNAVMAIGTVPLESLVICAADGKVIRDGGRVRSPRGTAFSGSPGHATRRDATDSKVVSNINKGRQPHTRWLLQYFRNLILLPSRYVMAYLSVWLLKLLKSQPRSIHRDLSFKIVTVWVD